MGRRKKMRSGANGAYSLADLQRLLEAKAGEVDTLRSRRESLLAELADVEASIASATGDGRAKRGRGGRRKAAAAPVGKRAGKLAGKRGGRRKAGKPGPRGEGGLQNMIRAVLAKAGSPMKLAEIADAVLAAGYSTGSSRFGVIVGQRLREMSDVKKSGRGMYGLK